MKHANLTVVTATLLAVLVWGCGEDPTCVDCCDGECRQVYRPQTSPENVVNNLQFSYQRKEIEEYAKLLDPTFIFKFQQADIPPDLPREYWNRDEDSTGTGALFNTDEVSSMHVDLGAFTVEDAGRIDEPGAKRIRLTHVKLEVDQVNGVTLLVQGDIQDMYFRKGRAAAGTDSTKWYLFEWWDESGGGRLKPTGGVSDTASGAAESNAHIQPTTWGSIKARF